MSVVEPIDNDVRLEIYRRFVEEGRPPNAEQVAETLQVSGDDAAEAYRRLADGHVIVLEPGTTDVWMANPLSARPTPFGVVVGERSYFGNCVWDALGVLAMLDSDGSVETSCPNCGEPMRLTVAGSDLEPIEAVAHFAVPAARWWDDIGFT